MVDGSENASVDGLEENETDFVEPKSYISKPELSPNGDMPLDFLQIEYPFNLKF